MSWADMMVAESPDVPLLLEDLPTQVQGEPIGENSEGDTSSDLFDMGDMEEDEEDYSTFPAEQPRLPQCNQHNLSG